MGIQLVVFDIAGTTVKDKGNINQAFRNAFLEAGIDAVPEDIDKVMGYRKTDAIKIMVDQYGGQLKNHHTIGSIHNAFTKAMVDFYEKNEELQPLPHAVEIFEWLQQKGIKTGLDTGFTRIITDAVLKRLGWNNSSLINTVVCSDEVPEGRPAPYMIQQIMKETGISNPKNVIKVGDTEVDVNEGKNAGCGLVVAVTTGAYTREELQPYQPDHIIDSLQELQSFIQ